MLNLQNNQLNQFNPMISNNIQSFGTGNFERDEKVFTNDLNYVNNALFNG